VATKQDFECSPGIEYILTGEILIGGIVGRVEAAISSEYKLHLLHEYSSLCISTVTVSRTGQAVTVGVYYH
jgi:hypothetical protein